MWNDEGAWIAIGISVLFLVAAFIMHRVFMKILKGPAAGLDKELQKDE